MPKNIEIKAIIRESAFEQLRERSNEISTEGPTILNQTDTFFQCQSGRLKLREFNDGTAELIAYDRPDASGPKTSDYVRAKCDGESMRTALERSLGIIGVVKKRRELFLVNQTRIHLDEVEELGTFLELEVVLDKGQSESDGKQIAERLMQLLDIDESSLIEGAYFDLLQNV